MKDTKRIKRFNYNLLQTINGLEIEKAKELCYYNGYILGGNVKFWSVKYELKNNLIYKAYYA
jgi:hypothetical protein